MQAVFCFYELSRTAMHTLIILSEVFYRVVNSNNMAEAVAKSNLVLQLPQLVMCWNCLQIF
ncbi:MAG: hypothetical protein Ta2B_03170 [Termitinemataceae bacterium]|nr:MAG: hypothetical protein Ta2B_03170 [Termitinemataceae bacterium]